MGLTTFCLSYCSISPSTLLKPMTSLMATDFRVRPGASASLTWLVVGVLDLVLVLAPNPHLGPAQAVHPLHWSHWAQTEHDDDDKVDIIQSSFSNYNVCWFVRMTQTQMIYESLPVAVVPECPLVSKFARSRKQQSIIPLILWSVSPADGSLQLNSEHSVEPYTQKMNQSERGVTSPVPSSSPDHTLYRWQVTGFIQIIDTWRKA